MKSDLIGENASTSLVDSRRFFRLPPEGKDDPIFGCPRSKYLQLERDGVLKLVRLIPKGKRRGIVLVPIEQMWAHFEALDREETEAGS